MAELTADTIAVLEGFAEMVASTDRYPGKDEFGDERTTECLEHARECVERARPAEPETGPGTWLPYPPDADQALAWARRARWTFQSYYKYSFTFTARGTLAAADAYEGSREFTATATAGGDTAAIYRYSVGTDPVSWDDICAAGAPYLIILDGDGNELIWIRGAGD